MWKQIHKLKEYARKNFPFATNHVCSLTLPEHSTPQGKFICTIQSNFTTLLPD
jgi:hypothetical protein